MCCSIVRNVSSKYKALWTKVRQNNQHLRSNYTHKRYNGLDQPPKFLTRTVDYQYGKDYKFIGKDKLLSIRTLDSRIKVPYEGWNKHLDLIRNGAQIGSANLQFDNKKIFLNVSLTIPIPDITPQQINRIVGVDLGQRNPAVTSTKDQCKFHSLPKGVKRKKNHYARLRKSLQRKGTRSAKRRLKAIGKRERRMVRDANHKISRDIVRRYPQSMIGFEDLTGIRERTERSGGSKKQRKVNRERSQWPFAEIYSLMAYKALLNGGVAPKVFADYTSQHCIECTFTSKKNRPNKGLVFKCKDCGYELNADLVGSRNVGIRTIVAWQDWVATGVLSMLPDVSDAEAKTECLRRYSELRWSHAQITSLGLQPGWIDLN